MKRVLISFALMAITFGVSAQTAEEIIASYIQKMGGSEKLDNLTSVRMEGTANTNGMEFPMTILLKGKDHYKSFVSFQGMDIVQPASYDGTDVWNTNPMTMQNEMLTGEAADAIKSETADFPDAFYTYKDNGYEIEKGEDEEVNGVPCYTITLVKPDQTINGMEVSGRTEFKIDKSNYQIIQKQQNSAMGALITVLSDHKSVNGITYPFKMETKLGGNVVSSVEFKTIETNIQIDDMLFSFPD
ncbi:hypothetical protein [Jiulongibacter sp. NS-SX5]|uniref:hypothetical protein n=1 Tax=Jiulongibacter sp. NS-SX5 TaxID=3463854 RepID=UPI00405A2E28